MVVCVCIARFALTVAAGTAQALAGKALALAPVAGGELRVGEVSGAAEAHGVAAGMAIGEALARCPGLELIAADPLAAATAWESALCALEGIGAAVESTQEGVVYFEADGLRGLHGSDAGTIAATRRVLARPAKIGAGPTRFCALAAALASKGRRVKIVDTHGSHAMLTATSIDLLGRREETAMLVEPLRRLGVRTLGELRGLGAAAMSDRFGDPGLFAYGLSAGADTPLEPRALEETLSESLHVGDAGSGTMLARVLGVLVDRLLARPQRRGRTLRAVVLSAVLEGGGTWRERVVFREAIGDGERMRLALCTRLALLPAPAQTLGLEVERFGPVGGEQQGLLEADIQARRERLREAIQQVRSVAGPGAALRAVCIDPDSRVPERRVVLTPLP
jgi:nucleotidyltransferase/DNA polymerase involved in DNA repair